MANGSKPRRYFYIHHRQPLCQQASDTHDAVKSIPYFHYDTFDAFFENLPKGARLVGVELDEKATDLETFEHPRRCVYLLGAEDHGLSTKAWKNAII